jgi:CheY-like chemotaxis protein
MKKIRNVLLIDDDEPTNFIHKKIIQVSGLVDNVHVAPGGQEALEFLRKNDAGDSGLLLPDLIFLDINMPAMDGWEFLIQYEKLKLQWKEKIIIVMLTTSLNSDDEIKAMGIKDVYGYRNKPLTKVMIEEIVDKRF